jgi:hypothetical protein
MKTVLTVYFSVVFALIATCSRVVTSGTFEGNRSVSGAAATDDIRALIEADWIAQDQLKGGGFRIEHTAEVVARGEELVADLRAAMANSDRLDAANTKLQRVRQQLDECKTRSSLPENDRRALHFAARQAVRHVMLLNPLLDFDRLTFVKSHPGRFAHMCDQYYGTYARPGGGLFVLENPWSNPTARSIVGDQLPHGSFLSPELSVDGATILFAFVPARADLPFGSNWEPVFASDTAALQYARWTADASYHIYRVNVDGSGLRQLTDGPNDDFDPCWLPDGRIAFVSTRRGGHCRCGGRPVPAYTLHSMNADGSDVRRLSHHETNEWHPSVSNDGRVLYTRWDYVDRHTNIAHSVWSTNTDGTDPVAVFGNYNRDHKPWGEWHPQPIPGSHKLLAIAGAHHGYAYGSLLLLDPLRGGDGQASLTRLTPDVPFPEAEGWPNHAFTTPLALSEKYYLVSYSPDWSTRNASHKVTQGIYLVDVFGNRELIYRDPEISCLSPIPLRARPKPASRSQPFAESSAAEGEFLVVNAAQSGESSTTDIKSLRVIQIIPKTTFRSDDPKISAARQVSARMLLGTVPVESDGSAFFKAPAGVPLYFQTVGSDGMAYQTMRTITYLQRGERRSCTGCHERRHDAPVNDLPLAAHRPASTIEPGPDGSQPFSYPRLVQPVLDQHCVRCHNAEKPEGKVVLTGGFTKSSPHSESYLSLTRPDLVHRFNSTSGTEWLPTSPAGQFGARQSKLIELLTAGHYDAKLDGKSQDRLIIWVDLNLPFYGAYEPAHVAAQREGKIVPLAELLQ